MTPGTPTCRSPPHVTIDIDEQTVATCLEDAKSLSALSMSSARSLSQRSLTLARQVSHLQGGGVGGSGGGGGWQGRRVTHVLWVSGVVRHCNGCFSQNWCARRLIPLPNALHNLAGV